MTAYLIIGLFIGICGVFAQIAGAITNAYNTNPKVKAKRIARLIAQDRLQRGLK